MKLFHHMPTRAAFTNSPRLQHNRLNILHLSQHLIGRSIFEDPLQNPRSLLMLIMEDQLTRRLGTKGKQKSTQPMYMGSLRPYRSAIMPAMIEPTKAPAEQRAVINSFLLDKRTCPRLSER